MSIVNPGIIEAFLIDKIENKLLDPYHKRYVKGFKLKGNEKVLDFACGGGGFSKYFAANLRKGGFLTCVDISKYWISKARKRLRQYSHVEVKQEGIDKLKDSYYDIINIHFALHDIEKTSRKDIIHSLVRKLKKGGKFFIREPTAKNHGMSSKEINGLMADAKLQRIYSKKSKLLLIKAIYTAIFTK